MFDITYASSVATLVADKELCGDVSVGVGTIVSACKDVDVGVVVKAAE